MLNRDVSISQTSDDFHSFSTNLEKSVVNTSSSNLHVKLMISILMPTPIIGHLMIQLLLKMPN